MSRKKKVAAFVLLCMLVVAFLYTTGYSKKKDEKLPKFHLSKKLVDLGEFFEGSDIKHTFVVRNHGVGELHILSVRPG
jgi:predicted membrane protein